MSGDDDSPASSTGQSSWQSSTWTNNRSRPAWWTTGVAPSQLSEWQLVKQLCVISSCYCMSVVSISTRGKHKHLSRVRDKQSRPTCVQKSFAISVMFDMPKSS